MFTISIHHSLVLEINLKSHPKPISIKFYGNQNIYF